MAGEFDGHTVWRTPNTIDLWERADLLAPVWRLDGYSNCDRRDVGAGAAHASVTNDSAAIGTTGKATTGTSNDDQQREDQQLVDRGEGNGKPFRLHSLEALSSSAIPRERMAIPPLPGFRTLESTKSCPA